MSTAENIESKIVQIEQDELPIASRLGAAVALLWKDLPKDARESILNQANHVFIPEYETVQLRQQLEGFIEKHGDVDLYEL